MIFELLLAFIDGGIYGLSFGFALGVGLKLAGINLSIVLHEKLRRGAKP